MVQNKQLIFCEVPKGVPVPGQHLKTVPSEINLNAALPEQGVLLKHLICSFDPYMRGRMRDASIKSYSPPFQLNQPMTAHGVAKVIKSSNPDLKEGDLVVGMMPIEEYTILPGAHLKPYGIKKLDNPLGLPVEDFVGALGMPGLTAYSSFYAIGKPKKGETIFISAASGAVGQIVGQLAKHEGLTVIGSVGSDEKLEYITKDLKFDAGFNYKKETPGAALKRLAPKGIDIYYENVGGEHLSAAIDALNDFGRIVACGMVSEYSVPLEERFPVRNLMQFVAKRLNMRGFIVSDADMGPVYEKERDENIAKWIKDGSFIAKSSVTEGIDNGADAFLGVLQGKNFGKAVLRIAKE